MVRGGWHLLRLALLTMVCWSLAACTTPGALKISELDRSLNELQRVVASSLPLGVRQVSENRREYFSQYFVTKDRQFIVAPGKSVRHYARVLILGDRRPYSIEILVYREKPTGRGGFTEAGRDKGLAKTIHQRLVRLLNERREGSDIIDDFRAF